MRPRAWLPLALLAPLAVACAATVPAREPTGVTSLQAGLSAAPTSDPRTTEAVEALVARDYARVLELTAQARAASASPWLDYDRGAALAGLAHTDQAVAAFRRAEGRFLEAGDDEGRAAAMWGRARALAATGRCAEARVVYEEYADFVRATNPRGADLAATSAKSCAVPVRVE